VTFYLIVVFLHVLAAFAMFAAMGIEWAAMASLKQTTDAEQARPWMRLLALVPRMAGPSGGTLLVTGVYMAMTVWGRQAWIGLGLLGLVLLAVLGGTLTGRRLAAIGRESAQGSLHGAALLLRLQDPVLILSLRLRTAIGVWIVFLMTTKPISAIALSSLVIAIVLGLAWAAPAFGRGRVAASPGAS